MFKFEFSGKSKLNILKQINISLKDGEVCYILGPNGSGKSTIAKSIMGFKDYLFDEGSISIDNTDLKSLNLSERSLKGIFLAFQNPVEIPGVNYRNFLRLANNLRNEKKDQLSPFKFKELLLQRAKMFGIDSKLTDKNLNENLSGGEKKKLEILQMAVLEPRVVILDEIESGLDFDATRSVYNGLKNLKVIFPKMMFIIITHSLEPFKYLAPDQINILKNGKIVQTGGKELLKDIENKGFENL